MSDPNKDYSDFKKQAKSEKDLAKVELSEKMAKRKNTSPAQTYGTIQMQERFDKNKISTKTDLIGDDSLSTDYGSNSYAAQNKKIIKKLSKQ